MNRLLLSLFFAGVCSASALAQEKASAPGKEEKITFDQHILPIFREKCGSCHNGNDKKGDLVLDNYGLAMQGGASGEVIRTDGDASQSQLYSVITHMSEPKMPPQQPKLPDEQLTLIRRWIEGGALENSGSKAKPKKNAAMAKVEISNQRPAGPPPMPENLPIDPLLVASRANGVTALAVNPWSPVAAVAGHKQILLYNTQNLELEGVLPFPEGVAHILKFTRDGQWLMAGGGRGSHSGKVILWDLKTGKRIAEVGSEYDVVLAADISPDHTQVALGGPKKIVRVYDTSTGELLYEKNKHTDWITALEFSPDGVLLATADRSNGLVVWEAFTGREFYFMSGHTGSITDVSWSPDSNLLASCSEDSTIRLWEMQNGNQVKNWGAHGGGVSAVEFTRDNRIASTGRDNQTKLWDINGAAIRGFGGMADLGMEVAFDSDLDRILAGDLTGVVHVWNAKDGAVIGQISTNPPSLAKRIEAAAAAVTAADAAAAQANAGLASINKGIADRKAAAEAATKAAADAQSAVDPATKAKQDADADAVAKTTALQTAEANLTNAQAAQTKTAGEVEAVKKTIADLDAKLKPASEAVAANETAVTQAIAAADAKPEDAALKAAVEEAKKKLADSQAVVADLNKQKTAAGQDLTAKTDALTVATNGLTNAKAARDAAATAKANSDKAAVDAAARMKAVTEAAATAKANAEKAVAAAVVTPEMQKQVTDAEAAAKVATEKAAALKSQLDRMNSAKGRTYQVAEGPAK